jgi:predicted phosphodiesterase
MLYKKYFPVLLCCIFLFTGCENDFFGLFGSTDLEIRWKTRYTFNFLEQNDLNITLDDAYSFLVVTDTHIYDGNDPGLEKLKDVIKNDGDIKFVVFNGDITQDGKRINIEKFIQIAGTLEVPCYPVIGNHDIYFGNWHIWEELIGSTCYRINCGNATLFILDSANAYFGNKQLDWLEDGLKSANGRVFVFSHVNLFLESLAEVQHFTAIRERARFISLLNERCDIIFTGHSHMRLVTKINGVININIEDFRNNAVYCHVRVSKNEIQYEFKKL